MRHRAHYDVTVMEYMIKQMESLHPHKRQEIMPITTITDAKPSTDAAKS